MNEAEIKRIFENIFHNHPNMCFPHPVKYFKHGYYLCEVAESNTANEGYYITVLEQYTINFKRKPKDMYIHVHDLCTHINSLNELDDYIKNKLNNHMTHNITLTIDDKIHKLIYTNKLIVCAECSLYNLCKELSVSIPCPAKGLGGEYFVELKIEK